MTRLAYVDAHWSEDWKTTVPTLRQYTEHSARRLAARHDLTIAEARRLLCEPITLYDWRELVVVMFDNGRHIPTRLLRSLDDGLLYRLARTKRALRSDEVTHDLIVRAGRPFLAAGARS